MTQDLLAQIATSSSTTETHTSQLLEMLTPPDQESQEGPEDPMYQVMQEMLAILVTQSQMITSLTERQAAMSKRLADVQSQLATTHQYLVDSH